MFGPAAYREVIRWPLRLIARGAEIAGQRDSEARIAALVDLKLASGLKLGQATVDPKNPGGKPRPGEPYHTFAPLVKHETSLERHARPWLFTPDLIRERREAEEERLWQQAEQALGGMHA